MKTFEEFITEGKKKEAERQRLIAAHNAGRIAGSMTMDARLIPPITPKEALKLSGRMAALKPIREGEKRMNKAVENIMKRRKQRTENGLTVTPKKVKKKSIPDYTN